MLLGGEIFPKYGWMGWLIPKGCGFGIISLTAWFEFREGHSRIHYNQIKHEMKTQSRARVKSNQTLFFLQSLSSLTVT